LSLCLSFSLLYLSTARAASFGGFLLWPPILSLLLYLILHLSYLLLGSVTGGEYTCERGISGLRISVISISFSHPSSLCHFFLSLSFFFSFPKDVRGSIRVISSAAKHICSHFCLVWEDIPWHERIRRFVADEIGMDLVGGSDWLAV
jgi:hypothetical protein